jgi:hypothetical protein
MPTAMTKEKFAEILNELAIRRFGEERAQSLHQAIQDIAQSLASIAEHRVELEEEPAFFF